MPMRKWQEVQTLLRQIDPSCLIGVKLFGPALTHWLITPAIPTKPRLVIQEYTRYDVLVIDERLIDSL